MIRKIKGLFDHLNIKILRLMLKPDFVRFIGYDIDKSANSKYELTPPPFWVTLLVFINPTYWIPESFCRGYWILNKGDLSSFILESMENAPNTYKKFLGFMRKRKTSIFYFKQKLFTRHFTRKVDVHYDIDPDIYSCFLDDEMVYTCAFFSENSKTLENAQKEKFSFVLKRIDINNDQSEILNIGCGWGSFERYLVRSHKHVNVTGLTISESQLKWANQHNESVLSQEQFSRINIIKQDYLEHFTDKKYDAICAIGMVEHVGLEGYREFFHKCRSLLKPNGKLLVHMMVNTVSSWPTNRWIDKHIFPGGYIPSVSELTKGGELESFRLRGFHIHEPKNYKMTLRLWRDKLYSNKDKMLNIYTSKYNLNKTLSLYLFKQWEMYLATSEASFTDTKLPLQVVHFIYEKYN